MVGTAWERIGVMRHGQAFRPGMVPKDKAPGSPLTHAGRNGALAVGHRFAETMGVDGIDASEVMIVHAPSEEAEATVQALGTELGKSGEPIRALAPAFWPRDESLEARWGAINAEIESNVSGPKRVLVLVGHDPSVSWLLHHLIGNRGQRWAGPVPLARGEFAMLGGPSEKGRALKWVLSPSDDGAIKELQDKIKSKMDTAKLLGAFLTALLLFAAKGLADADDSPLWYPWIGGLGLILLAMATAAYFLTMFMYDGLLMPVRFWPSPQRSAGARARGLVVRPPSSAAWVLYQNMMRVWFYGFIPATLLGGLGAIAVTIALAKPDRWWWLAVALSIAAVVALTLWVWRSARPDLGVSD